MKFLGRAEIRPPHSNSGGIRLDRRLDRRAERYLVCQIMIVDF